MNEKYFAVGYLQKKASIEGGKTYTFLCNTDNLNRNGWVTLSAGIDFTNFQKNPIVLWDHNTDDLPIGKATALEKKSDSLIATIFLDCETEKSAQISKLLDCGSLSAVSIGIRPTKTIYSSDTGEQYPIFQESELLEISVVSVPANADALRIAKVFDTKTDATSDDYSDLHDFNMRINPKQTQFEEKKAAASERLEEELDNFLKQCK